MTYIRAKLCLFLLSTSLLRFQFAFLLINIAVELSTMEAERPIAGLPGERQKLLNSNETNNRKSYQFILETARISRELLTSRCMNERCTGTWTAPWIVEILLRNGIEHILPFLVRIYKSVPFLLLVVKDSLSCECLPNRRNGSWASPLTG